MRLLWNGYIPLYIDCVVQSPVVLSWRTDLEVQPRGLQSGCARCSLAWGSIWASGCYTCSSSFLIGCCLRVVGTARPLILLIVKFKLAVFLRILELGSQFLRFFTLPVGSLELTEVSVRNYLGIVLVGLWVNILQLLGSVLEFLPLARVTCA